MYWVHKLRHGPGATCPSIKHVPSLSENCVLLSNFAFSSKTAASVNFRLSLHIILIIIIMDISTAPYLLKILQPKVRTKAIQTTITSHRHTHAHTHTHTHTHSHTRHHLRITCHQNTHAKRLKIKSLEPYLHSLSLLAHTQVQVTCTFTEGKVL